MTKRKLAVEIAKREGKKSEVAIGNIMEILTVLEHLVAEKWLVNDFDILDKVIDRSEKIRNKLEIKNAKKHSRT